MDGEQRQSRCSALRRDGQPCRSWVVGDASLCFSHAPGRQAERDQARSRGGRNRSSTARLRGLVPPRLLSVFDKLEAALDDVLADRLDPKNATAAASLARAMTAVLQVGELEERVRQLEQGTEQGWRP